MEDLLRPLRLYATFSGRARRREDWLFALANVVLGLCQLGYDRMAHPGEQRYDGVDWAFLALSVVLFLPNLAVQVRRLHDLGRSGWWSLIALIPIAGAIILLVRVASPGEVGWNQYGPAPADPAFAAA